MVYKKEGRAPDLLDAFAITRMLTSHRSPPTRGATILDSRACKNGAIALISLLMQRGERFNSISHLTGAGLSLIGGTVLIVIAALRGDARTIVSVSIYSVTLLLLYTFSTLYHSLHGTSKRVFRKLDHLSIYLLIAGSYTPFTLVVLGGAWGWSLFGSIWGLALFGLILDMFPTKGRRIFPVILYILMGWLIVTATRPLSANLPPMGLRLLIGGGLSYTGGVLFYALGQRVRHFHGIWHLFVLAGSICHYFCILLYVV